MKIDKKLIKELVDYLSEFNITEIEYQDGDKKVKVSKSQRGVAEQSITKAIVSPTKSVLSNTNELGRSGQITDNRDCLFGTRTWCKKIC